MDYLPSVDDWLEQQREDDEARRREQEEECDAYDSYANGGEGR